MVSKRWQRTQSMVAHIGLALGAGIPFYFFQTDLSSSLKLIFVVIGYLVGIPLILALHRRYAKTFTKVFRCEYEDASWTVQRALNARSLPFIKRNNDEKVVFNIRAGNMQLAIDPFPLNMMVDDHLTSTPAAKLTLQSETPANAALMRDLQLWLDEAFLAQGW